MSSIAFRFNKPVNYNYAPGFVTSSKNISGDTGEQGEPGSTIYFTDTELNNSYAVELALQRIENNYILSGASQIAITGRTYKAGDIIISQGLICYRIVKSNNTNFKFDIEYLGQLRQPNLINGQNVNFIRIYDITNTAIINGNAKDSDPNYYFARYPQITNGVTVNNRRYLDTSNNKINITIDSNIDPGSDCFQLYGRWYKCIIDIAQKLEGVSYTLQLNIPNFKTYNINTFNGEPTDNTDHIPIDDIFYKSKFKFNTKLNIISDGIVMPTFVEGLYNYEEVIFKEIFNNETNNEVPPIFISDMTADKLYFSKNNLKCTFNDKIYINDFTEKTMVKSTPEKYIKPVSSANNGGVLSASRSEIPYSRPGETAWFSDIDSGKVPEEIKKTIFNNNKFTSDNITLICTDNNTGISQIVPDVPIQFDDKYMGNSYKVTISGDKITSWIKE
jgi:hypothetical protein